MKYWQFNEDHLELQIAIHVSIFKAIFFITILMSVKYEKRMKLSYFIHFAIYSLDCFLFRIV